MSTTLSTFALCGCRVIQEVDATNMTVSVVAMCMKHWRMVPVEIRSDIKDARYAHRAGLPGAAERILELLKFAFEEINRLPQQQAEGGEA